MLNGTRPLEAFAQGHRPRDGSCQKTEMTAISGYTDCTDLFTQILSSPSTKVPIGCVTIVKHFEH
jgi:hypothetical protein